MIKSPGKTAGKEVSPKGKRGKTPEPDAKVEEEEMLVDDDMPFLEGDEDTDKFAALLA